MYTNIGVSPPPLSTTDNLWILRGDQFLLTNTVLTLVFVSDSIFRQKTQIHCKFFVQIFTLYHTTDVQLPLKNIYKRIKLFRIE